MALMPKPHRPCGTRLGVDLNHTTSKLHTDLDLSQLIGTRVQAKYFVNTYITLFLLENMKK
jgi:hypothetical protein